MHPFLWFLAISFGGLLWQSPLSAEIECGGKVCEDPKASSCIKMPKNMGERCPTKKVPGAVVKLIKSSSYVEQNCEATEFENWPYEAKECHYSTLGLNATVKIANPSAPRVVSWIIDSAHFIPRLQELKASNEAYWRQGVGVIAWAMWLQSGRIFPLEGGIIEDMAEVSGGPIRYEFEKGVTKTCSSGCYCRINSLSPKDYCAYQAWVGKQELEACHQDVGLGRHTSRWDNTCLAIHRHGWKRDYNIGFRAKALAANPAVNAACPKKGSCTPKEVVTALAEAFRVDLAQFFRYYNKK